MGVESRDGALRRRLAEDDLRARMDIEGMRRGHDAAALAPRGLGCAALPVAMLERAGGGASRSPWTFNGSGWDNKVVSLGGRVIAGDDISEPDSDAYEDDHDWYVEVRIPSDAGGLERYDMAEESESEDEGEVSALEADVVDDERYADAAGDYDSLFFWVGRVEGGQQVSGVYSVPCAFTYL